ncbi:hypothetical protein AYI69_g1497 [Smittium culicis]|uniref:Uncharacterized protein n=1 Tax=Smittium culicis TaxID=133412 RepID=A0A1R1YQ36_9FUNG|nr:hypothetical protein AYI69_g1497 [Smittium culicis]
MDSMTISDPVVVLYTTRFTVISVIRSPQISTTSSTSNSQSANRLSSSAVAAIASVSTIFLIALIVSIFLFHRKRTKKRKINEDTDSFFISNGIEYKNAELSNYSSNNFTSMHTANKSTPSRASITAPNRNQFLRELDEA